MPVIKLIPEMQMQLVVTYAMKAGFTGGLVVDFPNSTRAKKTFLCLFAGTAGVLPQARTTDPDTGHTAG